MTENIKSNGLVSFIRDSATTIFALGIIGGTTWIISNQSAGNVQLAVISVQLSALKENILNLKESVSNGDAQIRMELEAVKVRVTALEHGK